MNRKQRHQTQRQTDKAHEGQTNKAHEGQTQRLTHSIECLVVDWSRSFESYIVEYKDPYEFWRRGFES